MAHFEPKIHQTRGASFICSKQICDMSFEIVSFNLRPRKYFHWVDYFWKNTLRISDILFLLIENDMYGSICYLLLSLKKLRKIHKKKLESVKSRNQFKFHSSCIDVLDMLLLLVLSHRTTVPNGFSPFFTWH